jgi:hypothetical protein
MEGTKGMDSELIRLSSSAGYRAYVKALEEQSKKTTVRYGDLNLHRQSLESAHVLALDEYARDPFSFLDAPTDDVFSLNYASHDGLQCQTQITTPPEDAKRSAAESTALDQLRTQRDQDISRIQASMPRPLA